MHSGCHSRSDIKCLAVGTNGDGTIPARAQDTGANLPVALHHLFVWKAEAISLSGTDDHKLGFHGGKEKGGAGGSGTVVGGEKHGPLKLRAGPFHQPVFSRRLDISRKEKNVLAPLYFDHQ